MNISAQSTRLCILGWLTYQFVYLAVSPGSRVRFRITLVILGRPHVFTATKVFIITLIGIYAQSSNNFFPYYELPFWIWFVDFVNGFDYSSAWIVSDNNLEVRSVHQLSMHKGSNPIQSSRWNAKVEWHEKSFFSGFMWFIVIVCKNDTVGKDPNLLGGNSCILRLKYKRLNFEEVLERKRYLK